METATAPRGPATTHTPTKDTNTATTTTTIIHESPSISPLGSPGIAIQLCTDPEPAFEEPASNIDARLSPQFNGFHSSPTAPRPPPLNLGEAAQHPASHHELHRNLTSPTFSNTGWQSPARHHRRTPSQHREIKETTDARTEYTNDDVDGRSQQQINQYRITEEVGRGSYGAVHRAVDPYGKEFAVKEFSKSRLKRRAKSLIMRRPGPGRRPLRRAATDIDEPKDALYLIRQEIAVMKKLHHENLVELIEVLDDPEEDSLYMVLEMCKKGPVMNLDLNQPTTPLEDEKARHCFRDLILGIEYLHAQNICHRDIKPDNLLMTEDDILKIVDFGVSEMFDKPGDMRTSKSAGSPAFIPPELCQKHAEVSGTAHDIWSMGVCLYCFRYGKLPFEEPLVLDMYEAIIHKPTPLPENEDPVFLDLLNRLLEKDPAQRITMPEVRQHPWVTKGGIDPLLPPEENCVDLIEMPNALEVNHAFTRKVSGVMCVLKAITKFKALLGRQLAASRKSSGDNERSNSTIEDAEALVQARKQYIHDTEEENKKLGGGADGETSGQSKSLFLGIGAGGDDAFSPSAMPMGIVSDSPVGVEFNIYDEAFGAEVEHIRTGRAGGEKTIFETNLVGAGAGAGAKGGLWRKVEVDRTPGLWRPKGGMKAAGEGEGVGDGGDVSPGTGS